MYSATAQMISQNQHTAAAIAAKLTQTEGVEYSVVKETKGFRVVKSGKPMAKPELKTIEQIANATGGLKLKLAGAIVAISSISLLEVFLNLEKYSEWEVRWSALTFLTFVVSAVLLGVLERLPVIWKGDTHK